jgi:hypothetical protein
MFERAMTVHVFDRATTEIGEWKFKEVKKQVNLENRSKSQKLLFYIEKSLLYILKSITLIIKENAIYSLRNRELTRSPQIKLFFS